MWRVGKFLPALFPSVPGDDNSLPANRFHGFADCSMDLRHRKSEVRHRPSSRTIELQPHFRSLLRPTDLAFRGLAT